MCFAQFSKGTKSIDGSISWSKMAYDGDDLGSLLVFAPSAGYFLFDNLEIKATFDLSMFTFDGDVQFAGYNGVGIDYFKNIQPVVGYLGCSLNFEDIKTIGSTDLEFGILYGLNKHVYLDLGFDYQIGLGENKLSTQTIGIGTFVVF
jgi:hypothetical protein